MLPTCMRATHQSPGHRLDSSSTFWMRSRPAGSLSRRAFSCLLHSCISSCISALAFLYSSFLLNALPSRGILVETRILLLTPLLHLELHLRPRLLVLLVPSECAPFPRDPCRDAHSPAYSTPASRAASPPS